MSIVAVQIRQTGSFIPFWRFRQGNYKQSCNKKANLIKYSPQSHSCNVVRPWQQQPEVLPMVCCGQVVANARHHNVGVGQSSSADGLLHKATDANVDLKDRQRVHV